MKAGKLQRENSLLRFLVCHVILKVHTYISRWRLVCELVRMIVAFQSL